MTEVKKELGQHWLHDTAILQAIVDDASIGAGDTILEVGPGLGTLTEQLARTEAQVIALEYDKDLIGALRKKFNTSQVKILEGDVRTFDYSSLPSDYKVVANIPYYLTSYLIRSLSETTNPPKRAVLLVQKEVAERLCARPGHMSVLAVTAQFYFECSLSTVVPAHYFTPPPKVDSQVVVLRRREKMLFDVIPKDFFRFVKAGFSEKRKTLRNALAGGLAIEKVDAEALIKSGGISEQARAQELSLDDWYRLYSAYQSKTSHLPAHSKKQKRKERYLNGS